MLSINKTFNYTLFKEQVKLTNYSSLESVRVDKSVLIQFSKNDLPYIDYNGNPLHSKYDPWKEAARQVKSIESENKDLLLAFGAGLGYTVLSALQENFSKVIWIEPDLQILYYALGFLDFREYIRNGRLEIFSSVPQGEDLDLWLNNIPVQGTHILINRNQAKINRFYSDIADKIVSHINRKLVNQATLARFDLDWTRNILNNLFILTGANPISKLFGTCIGKNAVITGAGPSLYNSLDSLKNIRKEILLISVDTSVPVLQKVNIDPDIIVTVDAQPINRKFLESYTGEAIIVCDPTTSYHTLRNIPPHRLYYYWSPFPLADLLYSSLKNHVGNISFGGSVSTNAYDLAIKLECDKIYLIGQDLSFTDGLAHARGAVLEENLNIIESRIYRRELHNYRQLYALPPRYLPSIDGKRIRSNDKMQIFYRWFENRFEKDVLNGINVVNSTVSGAFFPGIKHEPLPPTTGIEFKYNPPEHDSFTINVQDFLDRLIVILGEIRTYQTHLTKAMQISNRLLETSKTYSITYEMKYFLKFKKMSEELDVIDNTLLSLNKTNKMIGPSIQNTILFINNNYGNLLSEEEKQNEFIEVAAKSRLMYKSLEKSLHIISRYLERLIFYFN